MHRSQARAERASEAEPQEPSRALVPVGKARRVEEHAVIGGTFAPLIAQLVAGRLNLPETRARRRADPSDAGDAYGRVRGATRPVPTRDGSDILA